MFELSERHCWTAFALACQPEFALEQPIRPVGTEDSTKFDSFEKPAIAVANSHAAQIDGLSAQCDRGRMHDQSFRWHFLYFLPLPHGHGSLRSIFRLRGFPFSNFTASSIASSFFYSNCSLYPYKKRLIAGMDCDAKPGWSLLLVFLGQDMDLEPLDSLLKWAIAGMDRNPGILAAAHTDIVDAACLAIRVCTLAGVSLPLPLRQLADIRCKDKIAS